MPISPSTTSPRPTLLFHPCHRAPPNHCDRPRASDVARSPGACPGWAWPHRTEMRRQSRHPASPPPFPFQRCGVGRRCASDPNPPRRQRRQPPCHSRASLFKCSRVKTWGHQSWLRWNSLAHCVRCGESGQSSSPTKLSMLTVFVCSPRQRRRPRLRTMHSKGRQTCCHHDSHSINCSREKNVIIRDP